MAGRNRSPENLNESSPGELEHLVVGNEPCTFVEVRDVLDGCVSAVKLWPKVIDIAKCLEIPTDSIISLEKRINNDMITYPGALCEILEAWRGKFSAEAKLQNLINVLERNGLADCAEALRIHFNAHEVSIQSTAKLKTLENLPERKMKSKLPAIMSGGATSTSKTEESSLEPGDNEHFVVGDEPCTYVEVRDVLTRCISVDKLWPKLIEVARSLKIPDDIVFTLKLRIANNTVTYRDALIEILEVWRGKFSSKATLHVFINVLETMNSGIVQVYALRIHFQEFNDAYVAAKLNELGANENLPEHFKSWMNKKNVDFQGNRVKFKELTDQIPTPVEKKILTELAEGTNPCIVNESVPEHLDYYILRTVRSRNILKIDVLKEECKDMFVIEGMQKYQLSSLVPDDESIDVSGNQLEKLTVRFIILQHPSDFDKISRLAKPPVHWVRYENERLEFIKSSGSVVNLQKHVEDSQDSFLEDEDWSSEEDEQDEASSSEVDEQNDGSFSEEELACRPERVVVIADSPGMGKTCLLANIAHQIISEQPNLVVRFIVLKEFVDALCNKTINMESIVKQIAEKSSEYEFGRKLVEHALKTQKCVLLFDGLDEVLSNQMTTAMEILNAAVTLPSAQVYVSTRPHFRDDVENQLHVLAYTIKPFNKSNQINFLTKFWTTKGAIGNDELTKFTTECVNKLSSMTDSEREIAGIPLQCRLLAEAYEEHAVRCSKTGYKVYEGADSVVMINSMFKIYEIHMNMRFKKMQKQESLITRFLSFLTKRNQYETIKQAHMYFALELLFPKHFERYKNMNKQSIPLNELCGLGILEATNSNDIRFVHRTFAEFLVAMLAHEYIQTNNQHRDILLSSLLKLTWNDLKFDIPFYGHTEFESFYFNFPVICYFLNGFTKNETGTEIAIDHHDEAIPYYISSAYFNFENIPHIVTRSITNINPIEIDELFKRNLFYVTAMYSGLELMKKFCSAIDVTQIDFMTLKESSKSDAYMITPLHTAVRRGHYGLVDYLLKKLEGKLAQLRYLMHFCVNQSAHESHAIVEDKIQIIKLLFKKKKDWIDEQLPDQTTPLMQTSVHVELLECLILEGANLNIRDENGNTALHAITENNELTPESYDRVLLSTTLELSISKRADLHAVNKYNNTALHVAVLFKRSERILDSLIKAGADERARGQYNRTVLHNAAGSANLPALKYFISRGHDVNVTDEDGSTPLHLAVDFSKRNIHEVVVLLVEHGADVNAIDEFGKSPLSYANEHQPNEYYREASSRVKLFVTDDEDYEDYKSHKLIEGSILRDEFKEIERLVAKSEVNDRTREYLEIAKMEFLLMKWESETIQVNMGKLSMMTSFESGFVKKLYSSGILTGPDVEELESIQTVSLRATKIYTMLLTKKSDFKILLSFFSDSNNTGVLSFFVKELISFLYNALMNLGVTGVYHVLHTKGYADLLQTFVETLEEVDRQAYANKFSILQFICMLNPQLLPPKPLVMRTLKQLGLRQPEKQLEPIQKIITHNVNQYEIQDLVYLCLANSHEHPEVDERKLIITNILQNHPSLYQKQPKYYPLLAPNIHVDLIIHAINLGVDVHATNERNENLLHLCAEYLTPEEYHRVVNALVQKQETELFHSRDEDQKTPLHVAVEHLELLDSTIQLFSSAKVDFNAADKYNDTALHNAVLSDRSERMLDLLIKAGADEKVRGLHNAALLHYAASSGNLTALQYFLLRGHDVNVTAEDGNTPLHVAVYSPERTHEIVVLLVEHGADVNAFDGDGETPLSLANGSESKVEARTKEYLESIIKQEAESRFIKCHVPILRKNMDKLSILTNFESGLLQSLTSCGILTEPEFEELVSIETSVSRADKFYPMLLTKKPDFQILLNAFYDSNNEAVLSIFVKEIISYLCKSLMNLEVTGVHHIMNTKGYADLLLRFVQTLEEIDCQAYTDKLSVVQLLCTLNPQVLPPKGSGMYTPLQLALICNYKKKFEFIQKIITYNVDVNERDSKGFTPLIYAVIQKTVPPRVIDIVKLLIENGADPDAVNQEGRTFLHWAPYFLTPELYGQLILFFDSSGRKDSLKLLTNHNHSHLHLAVVNFDPLPSTLHIFNSIGIDFNGQDNDGDCVVFLAIEGGRNAEFLSTLFEYGADWRIPNNNQENALHVAALYGNVSALELFIELGCDVNAKNIDGRTPLHNAFLGKSYGEEIMTEHEIVVMLLKERVDVTSTDINGKTAIDLAKERLKTGKVKQKTTEVLEKYSSK